MYRFIVYFALTLTACGEGPEYPSPTGVNDTISLDECTPGDRRINADGATFYCDAHGQWACQAGTHPEVLDGSPSPHIPMALDDGGLGDGDVRNQVHGDDTNPADPNLSDPNPGDVGVADPNPSDPNPGDVGVDDPERQCPEGALWLDQSINGAAEDDDTIVYGFQSVIFEPNETKSFCIRLPEARGNASRFSLGARGRYNDHGCEIMALEARVPPESTVHSRYLRSRGRAPDIPIAGGYAWEDPNLAPPGVYILEATEAMGDREPGEKVCRNYRILAFVQYRGP